MRSVLGTSMLFAVLLVLNFSDASHGQPVEKKAPDVRLVVQTGHSGEVSAVAFSRDGKQIVTANLRSAIVWDIETGRELRTLADAENNIGDEKGTGTFMFIEIKVPVPLFFYPFPFTIIV